MTIIRDDNKVRLEYTGADISGNSCILYFNVTNKTNDQIHFSIPRIWNGNIPNRFGVGQYKSDVKPNETKVIELSYFSTRIKNLNNVPNITIDIDCFNWVDDPNYESKMYEHMMDYDPDRPEPSKKIANLLFLVERVHIPMTKYNKK